MQNSFQRVSLYGKGLVLNLQIQIIIAFPNFLWWIITRLTHLTNPNKDTTTLARNLVEIDRELIIKRHIV